LPFVGRNGTWQLFPHFAHVVLNSEPSPDGRARFPNEELLGRGLAPKSDRSDGLPPERVDVR
jgi:hypothetical protein